MNNKGFGVVELAAWIVVTAFCVKLIAVVVIGASVASQKGRRVNMLAYNEIHTALGR